MYKRGRRTQTRIPGMNRDLDTKDFDVAEQLYYSNYSQINSICNDVIAGKYDT